jgi:hypothetical protein
MDAKYNEKSNINIFAPGMFSLQGLDDFED